jgi:hypothetical protein
MRTQLPDPLTGKAVRLEDVRGAKGTHVMVLSNHCPYVVHLKDDIAKLAQEYQVWGAVCVCEGSVTRESAAGRAPGSPQTGVP